MILRLFSAVTSEMVQPFMNDASNAGTKSYNTTLI